MDQDMRAAGAWVFTGGLHPPGTATVVRAEGDGSAGVPVTGVLVTGVLVTAGPFAEGKEHIGGFWIIRAADLDEALRWARRATQACRLPIEVRPMVDPAGD